MAFMPFFKRMTPVDSNARPTSKIKSSFIILQILITNQFDAERFYFFFHARTDEGVELMLKFTERRMRVKLGIAGRQSRQQFQNVIFINTGVLQKSKCDLRVADFFCSQNLFSTAGKKFKNR